jgi:hypothetical protein
MTPEIKIPLEIEPLPKKIMQLEEALEEAKNLIMFLKTNRNESKKDSKNPYKLIGELLSFCEAEGIYLDITKKYALVKPGRQGEIFYLSEKLKGNLEERGEYLLNRPWTEIINRRELGNETTNEFIDELMSPERQTAVIPIVSNNGSIKRVSFIKEPITRKYNSRKIHRLTLLLVGDVSEEREYGIDSLERKRREKIAELTR